MSRFINHASESGTSTIEQAYLLVERILAQRVISSSFFDPVPRFSCVILLDDSGSYFGPDAPASVTSHLALLQMKVDEIAARAGVPAPRRLDLSSTLIALPAKDRRRLEIVLEGRLIYTRDSSVQVAAGYILTLARTLWAEHPPPDPSPMPRNDRGTRWNEAG